MSESIQFTKAESFISYGKGSKILLLVKAEDYIWSWNYNSKFIRIIIYKIARKYFWRMRIFFK